MHQSGLAQLLDKHFDGTRWRAHLSETQTTRGALHLRHRCIILILMSALKHAFMREAFQNAQVTAERNRPLGSRNATRCQRLNCRDGRKNRRRRQVGYESQRAVAMQLKHL